MTNLTYTDDLPQESGFYFRKDKRTGTESVVKAIWFGRWDDLPRELKWYSASTQSYVPFTENFQYAGPIEHPKPKPEPTIEDEYVEAKAAWMRSHQRPPTGCHMCRQTFDDLHNACGITGRTELVVRLGEFYHVSECVLPGKFLFV